MVSSCSLVAKPLICVLSRATACNLAKTKTCSRRICATPSTMIVAHCKPLASHPQHWKPPFRQHVCTSCSPHENLGKPSLGVLEPLAMATTQRCKGRPWEAGREGPWDEWAICAYYMCTSHHRKGFYRFTYQVLQKCDQSRLCILSLVFCVIPEASVRIVIKLLKSGDYSYMPSS